MIVGREHGRLAVKMQTAGRTGDFRVIVFKRRFVFVEFPVDAQTRFDVGQVGVELAADRIEIVSRAPLLLQLLFQLAVLVRQSVQRLDDGIKERKRELVFRLAGVEKSFDIGDLFTCAHCESLLFENRAVPVPLRAGKRTPSRFMLHCSARNNETDSDRYFLTRSTYSPVRVSTTTLSPFMTNIGTVMTSPVSIVAGLPPPAAVSPLKLG